MNIDPILDQLEQLIASKKANCHFNPGVEMSEIESLESAYDLRFPESLKQFWIRYNGGVILNDSLERIAKRDGDLETAKWNSCNLMSTDEMIEAYYRMKQRKPREDESTFPYIPVCSTHTNEYLVLITLGEGQKETKLFDAFHEEPPSSWAAVADNFANFLEDYINTSGNPDVLGDEEKGFASDHLQTANVGENDEPSPDEVIADCNNMLESDTEVALNLTVRGIAYKDKGDLESALRDMNKAVDLEPKSAFHYFNRGIVYEEAGKQRAALIDYDSACNLAPKEALFQTFKAAVLRDMKRYDEALKVLEKAISLEPDLVLIYLIRENLYTRIGEHAKAAGDSAMIERLEND